MARFIFTGLLVLGYMVLLGFAAAALYRGSMEERVKEEVGRSREKERGRSSGWGGKTRWRNMVLTNYD